MGNYYLALPLGRCVNNTGNSGCNYEVLSIYNPDNFN